MGDELEFLKGISQYNLVNYLVPGVVFCVMAERTYGIDLGSSDLLVDFFVYYFVGMCLSRVGSLVVEPVLKWVGFIQFSNYNNYLMAEHSDPNISVLLETVNFYRSVLGGMVSFFALGMVMILVPREYFSENQIAIVVSLLVFILAFFGYRKQAKYVRRRVEMEVQKNGNS